MASSPCGLYSSPMNSKGTVFTHNSMSFISSSYDSYLFLLHLFFLFVNMNLIYEHSHFSHNLITKSSIYFESLDYRLATFQHSMFISLYRATTILLLNINFTLALLSILDFSASSLFWKKVILIPKGYPFCKLNKCIAYAFSFPLSTISTFRIDISAIFSLPTLALISHII